MAHFAKLDENSIVTQVVVVHNDVATSESAGAIFLNNMYGTSDTWKQTSYNTFGNQHTKGGTPFRKNFAGIAIGNNKIGFDLEIYREKIFAENEKMYFVCSHHLLYANAREI